MVAVVAVLATSCGSDRIAVDDLPVPPDATIEPIEGAYEEPLDLALVDIMRNIDFDGRPGERLLWLPDDVDPEEILAFYTEVLEEYTIESGPMTSTNQVRITWRNGDQRIVVAVIDASTVNGPNNFLALFA